MIFARPALGLILLAVATFLRADEGTDNQLRLTPYGAALLDYKSGNYAEARAAVEAAERAKPGDIPTEILKARILAELGDFAEGESLLRDLLTQAGNTGPVAVQEALGDLFLRQGDFNKAAKSYGLALQASPDDPDVVLKMVYAQVNVPDLEAAAKYASTLKPFDRSLNPLDPKHPGNPSYYFAKAALAQAVGKPQDADDDIQTARTLYGNTLTDRYLKTYLEVFAAARKTPASEITPLAQKPAPSGLNR